ncbi:AbiTii domain-containing protein [Rhodohalobacter sp. 614A]|uniref:AbiTii domain-containing protein n=1 Tax=Rhodohalobacter sp. 614A TaxID=2908649 RepID=UPI001F393CDB|nr:hypothetical protein [Rhodohalobacter sp. 614A]
MKIIKELRNDIVDSETKLSSALRKAKVLASILQDKEFKEWVDNELNGYDEDAELPSYRIIKSQNFGTFSGPFGSGAKNVGVPIWKMPENFQKMWNESRFINGIRELESLVEGSDQTTLVRRWPAEAVVLWNMEYEDASDYALVGAQSELSKSSVEAIIDTTRNKLLDFILELSEVDPNIMSSEEAISDLPKEQVKNIFNYTIYGSNNIVAGGQKVNQTVHQNIKENDLKSLANFLKGIGITDSDIETLKVAIDEDGNVKKDFGEKVKSWIGNMMVKASKGTWKVALETAPKLLTGALSNYYGIE